MRINHYVLAIALALATSASAAAQAVPTIPSCTAAEEKLWQRGKDSLGIFLDDQDRAIGGAYGAKKFSESTFGKIGNDLLAGYYPVSGYKEMACGILNNWSLYKLGKQELDLHPHISLAKSYTHLFEAAPPQSRGQAHGTCDGCIWGEVTLPKSFEWFWSENATSLPQSHDNDCGPGQACAGATLDMRGIFCAYGPWVMEKPHDFHVEIHPVQAFWGQTANSAQLYITDDDSDRFQKSHYFKSEHLRASPKPWSGSLDATLYQVIRMSPAMGATLHWSDIRGHSSHAHPSIHTGGGTVSLVTPDDVVPTLVQACTTKDDATQQTLTQVVLQARIGYGGDRRWRGMDISVSGGREIAYGHGGRSPEKPVRKKGESDEPWTVNTGAELSGVKALAGKAPASAREWGVDASQTRWDAVANQRLTLWVSPKPEKTNTAFKADWKIAITDLDRPGRTVSASEARISLDYDRRVATTVTGGATVHRHDTSQRGRFALLVNFPSVAFGQHSARVANLRVNVEVTISDGQRPETRQFTLYSIMPNFISAVSGYDLRANNGQFPARLAQVIAPWLVSRGCSSMTPASFAQDIAGQRRHDFNPPALWRLTNHRFRAAGTVRQSVNYMLQDETVTFEEFQNLLSVLGTYVETCRADP